MLKATREWGGKLAQGKAFGFLDGGRGMVGAMAANVAVFVLTIFIGGNLNAIAPEERILALKSVIWFYTILTFCSALLVWFFIPETKQLIPRLKANPFEGILKVLKSRSAWLQAFVVICAYCGYRGLDFYSLYAVEVLDMNEVKAAQLMSNATYLRPLGAISAGLIADRFTTKKVLVITFVILLSGFLVLYIFRLNDATRWFIFANLLLTVLTVYALRGIYFALFEETKVPKDLTGTTVGLVSLIGFTPDIFFNSIAGRIIDANPGGQGFAYFYLFLVGNCGG